MLDPHALSGRCISVKARTRAALPISTGCITTLAAFANRVQGHVPD